MPPPLKNARIDSEMACGPIPDNRSQVLHDSSRPLRQNLPNEILRMITEYFAAPDPSKSDIIYGSKDRERQIRDQRCYDLEALGNLRLVNSAFHNFATPYMFEIVTVFGDIDIILYRVKAMVRTGYLKYTEQIYIGAPRVPVELRGKFQEPKLVQRRRNSNGGPEDDDWFRRCDYEEVEVVEADGGEEEDHGDSSTEATEEGDSGFDVMDEAWKDTMGHLPKALRYYTYRSCHAYDLLFTFCKRRLLRFSFNTASETWWENKKVHKDGQEPILMLNAAILAGLQQSSLLEIGHLEMSSRQTLYNPIIRRLTMMLIKSQTAIHLERIEQPSVFDYRVHYPNNMDLYLILKNMSIVKCTQLKLEGWFCCVRSLLPTVFLPGDFAARVLRFELTRMTLDATALARAFRETHKLQRCRMDRVVLVARQENDVTEIFDALCGIQHLESVQLSALEKIPFLEWVTCEQGAIQKCPLYTPSLRGPPYRPLESNNIEDYHALERLIRKLLGKCRKDGDRDIMEAYLTARALAPTQPTE